MRNRRCTGLPFVAFGVGLLAAVICPTKLLLVLAAAALVLLGCCCMKSS